MKRFPVRPILLTTVAAISLAACGDETSSISSVSSVKEAPAVAGSASTSPGKPTAPISIDYEVLGKPIVGLPVAINIEVHSSQIRKSGSLCSWFSMTANPAPSTPNAGFDCSADPNDPENHEHSDPDFLIWQNGNFEWFGLDCEPNSEVTTSSTLAAGDHVIDINEFRHEDESTPGGFPDQVCFDFTAN